MKRKMILCLGLLCLLSTSLWAGTPIYVDPAGSDGNLGLTPATAKATIQAGINAVDVGGIVYVAPGTYNEFNITITKALTLQGASYLLTHIIPTTGSPSAGQSIIDVSLTSGAVTILQCELKQGPAIDVYSLHFDLGTGTALTISENKFDGVDAGLSNGFGIIGGYGSLGALTIYHNVITNFTNQNPILIERHLGTSQISYNTFTNTVDPIFYMTYNGDDVTALQKVTHNSFSMLTAGYGYGVSFVGSYYSHGTSTFNGLGKYTNVEISWNSFSLNDNCRAIYLGNDNGTGGGLGGIIDHPVVTHNTITGTGSAGSKGIVLEAYIKDAEITYNTFSNLDYGLIIRDYYGYGLWAKGTAVHYNSFLNPVITPGSWAIENDASSVDNMVDAKWNWWGAVAGPYDGKTVPPGLPAYNNPSGTTTARVTNLVDYKAFYTGNVVCVPDPLTLNFGNGTKFVDVVYLGGGPPLYGFSLNFNWDPSIVEVLSITEGPLLSTGPLTTIFINSALATNPLRVDNTRRNQTTGNTTATGVMFTIEFRNVAACGTSPIDLTLIKFRNAVNANITAGFSEDDGLIQVDMDKPSVAVDNIANTTVFPITGTNEFTKTFDALVLTATISDPPTACSGAFGPLVITADLSGLGLGNAVGPSSSAGSVYTWNITTTAGPGDGLKTVTVTATDGLGNVNSGSDNITLDNTLPAPATMLYANPKHQKVHLTWTPGAGDVNFYGYAIQYTTPYAYPLFAGMPWPAVVTDYPLAGSYNSGTSAIPGGPFKPIVGPASLNTYDALDAPRSVHYYRIYAMDKAANFSTASSPDNAYERATNYFLGDFDGAIYNGYVNAADLGWFSFRYWMTSLSGADQEADIGPTVATERTYLDADKFGVPKPDGTVDFEDLMIFGLIYGNVAPKVMPPADASYSKQFALNMSAKSEGQDLVVSVKLENNRTSVKGSSLSLNFDPQVLKLKNIESGSLFGAVGSQAFFAHKEDNGVVSFDAATMGIDRTVEYSGDIATLRFEVLSDGDPGLVFSSVKLRDGNNKEIPVRLKTSSANLPSSYALSQNYPNPFNPSSVIGYQVAEAGIVTIDIYNALGAKVMTLVNGSHEAGSYQALLDASSLSSGLYYYTMRSGTFLATRSMTVAK